MKSIKHLHNRLVTVHGLDFGIPAETTAFVGLTGLVYNDERRPSLPLS